MIFCFWPQFTTLAMLNAMCHRPNSVVLLHVNKSSAVTERTMQCCTSQIVKMLGGSFLGKKFRSAHPASWIILYTKITGIIRLHFCRRHCGSSFSLFNIVGSESCNFEWSDAKKSPLYGSRSLSVTSVGSNWIYWKAVCDFLLLLLSWNRTQSTQMKNM